MGARVRHTSSALSVSLQAQAHRVVKDVQRYTKALEEMAKASKALGDSIKMVYEPEWSVRNKARARKSARVGQRGRTRECVRGVSGGGTCVVVTPLPLPLPLPEPQQASQGVKLRSSAFKLHPSLIVHLPILLTFERSLSVDRTSNSDQHRVGSEPAYNKITELDQTYQNLKGELSDQFNEPLKSYLGDFPAHKVSTGPARPGPGRLRIASVPSAPFHRRRMSGSSARSRADGTAVACQCPFS